MQSERALISPRNQLLAGKKETQDWKNERMRPDSRNGIGKKLGSIREEALQPTTPGTRGIFGLLARYPGLLMCPRATQLHLSIRSSASLRCRWLPRRIGITLARSTPVSESLRLFQEKYTEFLAESKSCQDVSGLGNYGHGGAFRVS